MVKKFINMANASLVQWEKVCMPKSAVGVLSLGEHNKALPITNMIHLGYNYYGEIITKMVCL
jgi:hypothetical protein